MTASDERRRVAQALRGYARRYKVPTWKALCNIVMGREEGAGDLRKIHMLDRLADLIEPDEGHFAEGDKMVDREALIAIAEEMSELSIADYEPIDWGFKAALWAQGIRDALGEE